MIKLCQTDSDAQPDNSTVQPAIDALAASGGGALEIPAGTYQLRDAVHLRDNVRLVGEDGTVFTRDASIESPLLNFCGFGMREFVPRDPDLFDVGMGVCLWDNNAFGFYTTVATIVDRSGDRFYVDRPFHHDYLPMNGAVVATLFPLIDGLQIVDASIENLVLDGHALETRQLNGCLGGGIILLGSQRIAVRGVEVRHFNGDGISFQQCTDILVQGCEVHDNKGGGLHPGSGSVRYVMEDNHVHRNGGHGLFYCLRTTHSRCRGNRIEWNGRTGISVGEMDTDHWIADNTIACNGEAGIDFRPPLTQGGDRVTVEGNRFSANCRVVGEAEIVVPEGLNDIAIVNNEFETTNPMLLSSGDGSTIYAMGNRINGTGQTDKTEAVTIGAPESLPRPEPADLPCGGAKHLGITRLAPWTESWADAATASPVV